MSTEIKSTNDDNQQPLPPGVAGWSWGAFLLTWVWGFGNKTYRALWCLVPIVGFFMWIALGIKGREWAWRHKHWNSVEEFNKTQRRWAIAGWIVFGVSVVVSLLAYYS